MIQAVSNALFAAAGKDHVIDRWNLVFKYPDGETRVSIDFFDCGVAGIAKAASGLAG